MKIGYRESERLKQAIYAAPTGSPEQRVAFENLCSAVEGEDARSIFLIQTVLEAAPSGSRLENDSAVYLLKRASKLEDKDDAVDVAYSVMKKTSVESTLHKQAKADALAYAQAIPDKKRSECAISMLVTPSRPASVAQTKNSLNATAPN